jgi:hypothetical protein
MVKYILNLSLCFFLCSCSISKQVQDSFQCDLINEPIAFFKVDVFGNLYTVDSKNQLRVYDQNLNLLFEYFNNRLGQIDQIDISNPRKIILFFSGFQKMIFLDNTLSEIARVDFESNILPFDIRAIGSSRDNNIWIYDASDYKLKKIDPSGKILIESNPLESYLKIDLIPNYIIEYNNEVFLVEENIGFVVFDNFGNYLRYNLIENISSVHFQSNVMIYNQNGVVYTQNLKNTLIESNKIADLPSHVRIAFMSKKGIFYLDNNCLTKYEKK